MLPPVDDEVLRANPAFAALYSTLTSAVLGPDGSTRRDAAAAAAARDEQLDAHRLAAARRHFLERAIAAASPPDPGPDEAGSPAASSSPSDRPRPPPRPDVRPAEPPGPLLDLVLALPPLLDADAPLAPASAARLLDAPPLCRLRPLLRPLAALVSSALRAWVLDLARVAHPTADSSRLNRLVPSLPEHHARLVADVAAAREALAAARLRALASLSRLVACHTQALLHLVRALEAKHGLVARGLELRAADVSLRAQRTELDAAAAVHALERDVFPPPAAAALRSYAVHLRDAKLRAAERVRALQAELAEHGIGDAGDQRREETMREMARERRGIIRQMEHVERDFDRRRDG